MPFGFDLGNLVVHLRANILQFSKGMKAAELQMAHVSATATRMGRQMSLAITAPLAIIGAASVKAFAGFESEMIKSTAIMKNITADVREEMEKTALEISTNSITAVKDLAEGYFFLASAGLNAQQSIASLGAVNDFAVAGMFDMATATDLATDAQSALGLTVKDAQKNLKNMTRVTDVLVGANTLANATVEQFATSLTTQAGPTMKAFNIDLEEGVAVLAAYADQGIKSQLAGSSFSRMLRLMTKGFRDNREGWDELQIDIFDTTGELKPLSETIENLTNAFKNMSTEQKGAALELLGFKARSQQAILPLLGLGKRIKEYNEELLAMSGITKEVADKQLKSFTSQMLILKNQITALGIELGTVLLPHIISLTDKIEQLVGWMRSLEESTKSTAIRIGLITAAIGPALLIFGGLTKILTGVLKTATLLTKVLKFLGAAIIAHPLVLGAVALGAVVFDITRRFRNFKKEIIAVDKIIGDSHLVVGDLRFEWEKMTPALLEAANGFEILAKKMTISASIQQIVLEMRQLQDQLGEFNFFEKIFDVKRFNLVKGRIEALKVLLETHSDSFVDITEEAMVAIQNIGKETEIAIDDTSKNVEDRMTEFSEAMKQFGRDAEITGATIAEQLGGAINGLSQELAILLVTGKANFKAFAQSLLVQMAQIIIQAILTKIVLTALGLGGAPTGGATGSIPSKASFGLAKGGVINNGNVVPFRNGGVIDQPTTFPMTNGKTGLMGEGRDPEGIFPLGKDSQGRLGVRGSEPQRIKIVNVMDRTEMLDAMSTTQGERVIINALKRNRRSLAGILG